MGKTAGKGGKNDGEKASKGLGPSKKINKKAPKASSEELSEAESDEDLKNKKKERAATKAALKTAPKPPSSSEESDDGSKAKTSKKASKTKKKSQGSEMMDTIAIVFDISNEKHPFFHLNGVNGSIDLENCGIGVEDVIFLYFILNILVRTMFIK